MTGAAMGLAADRRLTVGDIMTRDVVTIAADAPVADLVRLFDFEQISGVPVLDDQGRPVGVASVTDVVRALRAGSLTLEDTPVGEIMTPATLSVRETATLAELAQFFLRGRMHRSLVMEGDRLAGIVTASDLVRTIAGGLPAGEDPPGQ